MHLMNTCASRKRHFENSRMRQSVIQACVIRMAAALLFWLPGLSSAAASVDSSPANTLLVTSTPIAITFMVSMLVLKITAFVIGYLVVRLGHDTLIRGVSGDIDFGFSGSGYKAKLKAASPGAIFVLMGAAIIIWGLTVEKPMEIKIPPTSSAVVTTTDGNEPLHRAQVPD